MLSILLPNSATSTHVLTRQAIWLVVKVIEERRKPNFQVKCILAGTKVL